jgi:ribosomal protein S18 acetylase RimI-like enzyme
VTDATAPQPTLGVSPAAGEPRFAAATARGLTFRPIVDADLPFLTRLYGSTRAHELAPVPWSEAEKDAFIDMQFRAQHAHYVQHYPTARFLMVLRADVPAGRLYVDRWAREHRIMDIAFMPEHCGQGLGTALLGDLLAEGAAAGKCVTIHVEKNNPAMRLYRRLGFVAVEDKGVYDLMRWDAP